MATRRIQIRGIILDARFDASWMDGLIEKGIFTPESRVRRELDEARKAGDDVEVVVSSQGGSVFSGFEMSNAIRDFAKDGKLELTVGAFAASAAAMIVLDAANAGIPVRAHRNSVLLYHGAWSVTEGGSGAHEDSAKLLDQINSVMKDGLKARGVPQAMIDEGFGEGRQMTMTAAEAQSYGIVAEISDALAEKAAKPTDEELGAIRENGLQYDIAAWAAGDGEGEGGEGDSAPASEAQPAETTATAQGDGALLAEIDALKARLSALQSGKDKEIAALKAAHSAETEKACRERDDLAKEFADYRDTAQKTISDLTAKLDAATAAAEEARANHASLVGALNAPAAEDAEPRSWREAIDRFGLTDAIRRFPDLARQFRESRAR